MPSQVDRITWRTALVEKSALGMQDYLNRNNFQPGEFIVLDYNELHYLVVYVEKREPIEGVK